MDMEYVNNSQNKEENINNIINISVDKLNNDKNLDEKIDVNKNNKNTNIIMNIKPCKCGLIVIDNFYNNAMETREYILKQQFMVTGNFPGKRTISYANTHLKDTIQKYVEPFGGKIIDFPIPKDDLDAKKVYNGSFQYTTSRDRSWIHMDHWNNWAGVLFLTPNAPLTSGTGFYQFYDGSYDELDMHFNSSKTETDIFSQDITKWKLVDSVGNIFNRLILFNSKRFHMSMDYFGDSLNNGRLFQVFFFSTER
jgi:hypothetical protein